MSGLFTYSNPRAVHWGRGSVSALAAELKRLEAARVTLVTTQSLVAEERLVGVVQRALGDTRVAANSFMT